MTERNERADPASTKTDKDVGTGEGGAEAGGAGNILAVVQPVAGEDDRNGKDGKAERRHD